ncbi:MAG TPA: N-methyl-L-tryptophan oxidase [Chthoniobacterales bacterium]|jgi:sarcosine oxidase|nr:N-methyl-L-tryptophan oxidase [Chthoniobacterales bacterium]
MTFDVAVAGLGGIGSAIAARCAARGASVIGLEQFGPAHDRGSSHGKSRMIRQAYFEDAAYVRLVLRSYELWRELEQKTAEQLLRITGVLSVGEEGSEIISGTKRSAAEHDLRLETFTGRQLRERYPTLQLLPNEVALFEPDGGVLDPERAVGAHLKMARSAGADLRFQTEMRSWEAGEEGIKVVLEDGSQISARTFVLSLGPWFKKTLESLGVPLRIQRNVQAWFSSTSSSYGVDLFPAFLLDRAGLPAPLYGFPDFGDGVKAAFHGFGHLTTASELDREVNLPRDVAPIAAAMEQWMPGAAAKFREAKPCMYSLTPDGNFVIDRHPQHPNVILCGGFSGHGFKFAPVIGEIAADLALDGGSRHRIDFLSLERFRRTSSVSSDREGS